MRRRILKEAEHFYLHKINNERKDYGGSHCYEKETEEDLPITENMILSEKGHFAGVIICESYTEYNGHHLSEEKDDKVIRVSDIGTSKGTCEVGSYYGDDDHSRWNITRYTLRRKEEK